MTCAHVLPLVRSNHFTFIKDNSFYITVRSFNSLVHETGVFQHSAWSLVYCTIACVLEEVTNQIHSKQEMKATMFVLH